MDLEMQCLEQQCEALKAESKEEEKKLWTIDMEKNRKITQLEAAIRKYNAKLPALGVAPESGLYLDVHKPVGQVQGSLQVSQLFAMNSYLQTSFRRRIIPLFYYFLFDPPLISFFLLYAKKNS